MKKQILFFAIAFVIPHISISQETEQKLNIAFSGFVGYEMYFDTYNSVTSRDGDIYLYPLPQKLDINGNDINKNFQAQMLAVQSRTRMTASGLSAFGAQAKGIIEGDFLGTATAYTRLFRLRHAYIQLNWEKGELITGQTWHPMFVVGCYPDVFAFGAGLPFHPLNRAPQIRYTYKPTKNLDIMGALLYHGDFASTGPANAQQNSGIPDMQFQFIYKNDFIFTGITAGYKVLQPRDTTALGAKTTETIGSYNFQAFAKASFSKFVVKLEGIYGQNLTNFVMIGGYGASESPALVDDYSYINLNTVSVWSEVTTKFDRLNFGIFAGYSANLGANGDYFNLNYDRDQELDYIYRVSPYAHYTSGKMTFIFEYLMTGAAYGTAFDNKNKATSTADATVNHRIILGAKYNF